MLLVVEAVERLVDKAELTHSDRGLIARVQTEQQAQRVETVLEDVRGDRHDIEITRQQMRDHFTVVFEKTENEITGCRVPRAEGIKFL